MPKRLPLTLQQRRKVFREYAKGATPSEIANSHRELGLNSKQVQNLILREGWAQKKREIAEVREKSVEQILAEARKESAAEFGEVLHLFGAGLQDDAKRLSTGWNMVGSAADASSLMRAKKLHLSSTFEFYGASLAPVPPSVARNIAAVFVAAAPLYRLSVLEKAEQTVDVEDQGESNDHSDIASDQ